MNSNEISLTGTESSEAKTRQRHDVKIGLIVGRDVIELKKNDVPVFLGWKRPLAYQHRWLC